MVLMTMDRRTMDIVTLLVSYFVHVYPATDNNPDDNDDNDVVVMTDANNCLSSVVMNTFYLKILECSVSNTDGGHCIDVTIFNERKTSDSPKRGVTTYNSLYSVTRRHLIGPHTLPTMEAATIVVAIEFDSGHPSIDVDFENIVEETAAAVALREIFLLLELLTFRRRLSATSVKSVPPSLPPPIMGWQAERLSRCICEICRDISSNVRSDRLRLLYSSELSRAGERSAWPIPISLFECTLANGNSRSSSLRTAPPFDIISTILPAIFMAPRPTFSIKSCTEFCTFCKSFKIPVENFKYNAKHQEDGKGKDIYQANALTSSKDTIILKRFNRDTSSEFTDIYNDENGDVIPGNDGFEYKSFVDHILERAQQAAESFQSMWHSITDSFKHAMDALRGFFSDDSYEMYTHEDYEEQQRLQIIETLKKES
uniref:Uncharacterized protein n=1 Tax=Glossina austeni TaxID=7395 RepID=A0A1A9VD68_GLOAU